MGGISAAGWGMLFALSAVAASLALFLVGLGPPGRQRRRDTAAKAEPEREGHFLLEDHDLIGQDLRGLPRDHPARNALCWEDLHRCLAAQFPGLPDSLHDLPENRPQLLRNAAMTLDMLRRGQRTRLILGSTEPVTAPSPGPEMPGALTNAPDPVWCTDPQGGLLWCNAACARLFADPDTRSRMMAPQDPPEAGCTSRVHLAGGKASDARVLDIHHVRQSSETLHFARDMTPLVHAQTVQREFVQTLTKTFANLTTGLAIFDKRRRLTLFNPALVDLTGMNVPMLSARPDLMDFFDHLREAQIMPEPRDYADWRAQIRDAVSQADAGLYHDVWSLPDGLTYRITGRPHPDGAVAFLFEDISSEITLTRRFRAQIDLRQSVLDNLEEAIAVFAPNNLLMFCNTPCTTLLKIDPDHGFADMSLRDVLSAARATFGDSAQWRGFAEPLLAGPAAERGAATVPLPDGRRARCRLTPLGGGARMLRITVMENAPAAQPVPLLS